MGSTIFSAGMAAKREERIWVVKPRYLKQKRRARLAAAAIHAHIFRLFRPGATRRPKAWFMKMERNDGIHD